MSAIDECAGAGDMSMDDWENLIEQYIIGRNAERNRKIIKRRLLDGICYEPLSEEFGLSVRQTKKIVYAAENKLLKYLKSDIF